MGVISNGTTLLDAGALDSGVPTGATTLIKTLTASNSATLDFVHGASSVVFDGTYKKYVFKFINIHPATDSVLLTFQVDTGTNTNYNIAVTSSLFRANQNEADGGSAMSYRTGSDQAQGTAFQQISQASSNDNDSGISGELTMFSPSSGTFIKHFISTSNTAQATPESQATYCAGYFNTTTALTRVQFKMSSGNIDLGTIKLYGIS